MHSVQADDTLGGPHVQAHGKSMRDVVMHSLLHTPTKFCIAKQKDDISDRKTQKCFTSAEETRDLFFFKFPPEWKILRNLITI